MNLKVAFKFVCILALSCAGTIAVAEPTSISMTKNNKNDKFEVVLDDKNAGRLIFFVAYHGTWKQTKGGTLIDGGNNKGSGYADLTNGRGHISGADIEEKDGDSYKSEWAGQCYPANGPDGKVIGHCAGSWFVVPGSGTGRFANISGGGYWHGHDIPGELFKVESTGTVEK
jgi:hypothetical protein